MIEKRANCSLMASAMETSFLEDFDMEPVGEEGDERRRSYANMATVTPSA